MSTSSINSVATQGDLPKSTPSTSHFVNGGGLKLHYLDYGTAGRPAMVCVHGGGANAHWYDFVASGFNDRYHVLAPDLRGHGDSAWVENPGYGYEDYALDLKNFFEALDLRDMVLIGHSMGGLVSLTYMRLFGERVAKLVIVDSAPIMTEDRKADIRSVGDRPSKTYAKREEVVAKYRMRPESSTTPPAVIRYLAEHGVTRASDGNWRLKFDRRVFSTRTFVEALASWQTVRVPALLIKGERSGRVTTENFARVKAVCPQVEMATVAASDHHVTLDNPAGFIAAVSPFLAQ